LRNGPWFGINETNDFAPASLMKLPVAIAYMKWSEYLPSIKDASFSGVVDSENSQNIPPDKSVDAGKSYTLDELISMSLAYSDNNANSTLTTSLPKDIIYKVFTDLNLPIIDQLEA
jgi:beta-lactamase class A